MDADDVGPEQNAGRDRGCRAPVARSWWHVADARLEKRFAGWAGQDGSVEGGQRLEPGKGLVGVFWTLGETETRVDHDRFPAHAGSEGNVYHRLQLRGDFADDVAIQSLSVH